MSLKCTVIHVRENKTYSDDGTASVFSVDGLYLQHVVFIVLQYK